MSRIYLQLNGGPFWKDYNKRFHPVEFEVPEWVEKVEIASFITGHGFGKDKENCAEFCNHTHHISINGHEEHAKLHPEANRVLGCLEQVPDGVVPNQGGTWVYGRAAWCPGLDVKPWVIDITDEVTKGVVNELTYRGLFDGKDYVAEKGPGQGPNQGFDANISIRARHRGAALPVTSYAIAPVICTGTMSPTWTSSSTITRPSISGASR